MKWLTETRFYRNVDETVKINSYFEEVDLSYYQKGINKTKLLTRVEYTWTKKV